MHLGLVDMRALPIAVAIPMSLRAPGEGGSASTNLVDDFVGIDDSLAALCQMNGLGPSSSVLGPEFDRFDEGWDAVKTPRFSQRSVSSLNQRSTRFSHEELSTVKSLAVAVSCRTCSWYSAAPSGGPGPALRTWRG